MVSSLEPLSDDHAPPRVMTETEARRSAPVASATKEALPQKPAAISVQNPRILYLRVTSTEDAKWKKALNILEIFEGSLPVSVYDASRSTYEKLSLGFDCTEYTLRELISILGKENVVLK